MSEEAQHLKSDVKIQINSKEALERLLGGNEQLVIEARNSLIQQFARQYLKPLVNETDLRSIKQEITQAVDQAKLEVVSQIIGTRDRWTGDWKLTSTIEALIKQSVDRAIEGQVNIAVRAATVDLDNKIKVALDKLTPQLQTYLDSRLKLTVNNIISDKMGVILTHLNDLTTHYKSLSKEAKEGERNIQLQL